MIVRAIEKSDIPAWADMRLMLWPHAARNELESEAMAFVEGNSPWIRAAFIARDDSGEPLGFIELNLRSVAEGATSSPVPHVEGWFVMPNARRIGVGRALMDAAQTWALANGFTELTSDTTENYPLSVPAHLGIGFEEVERLIAFRKKLI